MRILVLSQEDHFYIPRLLDHLFTQVEGIVAVGIVPGEMRSQNVSRFYRMMGLRDMFVTGLHLSAHKALDLIGRAVPLAASYSVAGAARRHGIPTEAVPKVNAASFVESVRERQIDLIVSVACPQIMKAKILEAPTHGCINIHGALLPRYQGLLPSFWVLAKGEKETGVTVHFMDATIDHGDIILQRTVPIRDDDTVHSLVKRSKIEIGKEVLVEAIRRLASGTLERKPMDHSQASYFSYPDDDAVREFRRRGRRFI